MFSCLRSRGLQQARLPYPSLSLLVCSNICPLSQWCHPTIPSSVIPFSFCLQSFPASFPMSWLFTSGIQVLITTLEGNSKKCDCFCYLNSWHSQKVCFPVGLSNVNDSLIVSYREELTFEMLVLEPRASDDETLESEASIGTADSSENLNIESEGAISEKSGKWTC